MKLNKMQFVCAMSSGILLALTQTQSHATGVAEPFAGSLECLADR